MSLRPFLVKVRCLSDPLHDRGYNHEPLRGDFRVLFFPPLPYANPASLLYVRLGAFVFKEMPQEELCFVGSLRRLRTDFSLDTMSLSSVRISNGEDSD